MGSVPERRNNIVQTNIPKLIKSLTGFHNRDENFRLCLQFTWSMLKNHRYGTVNSHEVKRTIDGICEKLRFSNFHETEQKFRSLIDETITHELVVNHYERDVIYSILDLLTTLAYDPISRLKEKLRLGHPIFVERSLDEEETSKTRRKSSDELINNLLKDNFNLKQNETDSDLSDWTDSDSNESEKNEASSVSIQNVPKELTRSKLQYSDNSTATLKPPQKFPAFSITRIENPRKWLSENIQNTWWKNEVTECEITSAHPSANFNKLWQKHLTEKSLGFIKPKPVSLLSEYCLLREIFWMFLNPSDCKFFMFQESEIVLRPRVSLHSTSAESLQIFMEDIIRPINVMYQLKSACINSYQSSTLSHTFECYFREMQSFLDRILNFILEEEELVRMQNETYTIVTFCNKLRPHAKSLEILWKIHSTSVLSEEKYSPHICASFLLTSLHYHVINSCQKEMKNIATALLLVCLKTFLRIFDIWWTEARLHDLKKEFLVERNEEDDREMIDPRLFQSCKEKSFFINEGISKKIMNDSLMTMMLSFSVKASFTFDIISKLDLVHEMRQIGGSSKTLYELFMEIIHREIKKLASHKSDDIPQVMQENEPDERTRKNRDLVEDIRNGMMTDGDELLVLTFQSTFDRLLAEPKQPKVTEQLEIFDILNASTNSLLMPLEHIIQQTIENLLCQKISIADKFVMDIYRNELHVEYHFQLIRKVFFLECNELMNFFYTTIFPKIEAGESNWANPYLLTTTINDILCSNQTTSMPFTVQINRKIGHFSVLSAVNELTIYFNVNHNLKPIFTSECIEKYNEVFKVLLTIKWGLQSLNCLRFPDFFKDRAPFAKFGLLDLVIKRLSLIRFSMQHTIGSLHSHIMALLQGLSQQLDAKVAGARNISQLITFHSSFVNTFYKKVFLDIESANIRSIITELLKLVKILKDEWLNITKYSELDASGNIEETSSLEELDINTVELDKAYKSCDLQLKIILDS